MWSFSGCFALAGSPIFAGDEVDGEAAPWASDAAGVVDVERGGAVIQGHEVSSGAGVDGEFSSWASGALGVVDVEEDPVAGDLEDGRAIAILHREEGFVSGKAFRGFDGHAGDGVQGVRYGGEFDRRGGVLAPPSMVTAGCMVTPLLQSMVRSALPSSSTRILTMPAASVRAA